MAGHTIDNEEWEELLDFLDERKFYIEDMLACICANLCRNKAKQFTTKLKIGGYDFRIRIEKDDKSTLGNI